MSTYQMSEFGIPLDARPAKHGGSQSMTLNDVEFKFKLRHCMVHFLHRAPTKKEMEEMTPVVLTQGELHGIPALKNIHLVSLTLLNRRLLSSSARQDGV